VIELGQDQNYAMIGNVIMERLEGEPVPTFRSRARDTALDLGADLLIYALLEPLVWVDDIETVVVEGGLSDGRGDFATVGDSLVEREDGESVEAFHRRARELATARGSCFVVFGGLPPTKHEGK
jgi:hypothetical protein